MLAMALGQITQGTVGPSGFDERVSEGGRYLNRREITESAFELLPPEG
jgi:hypothetical protein